jgi:hypothetical protein
VARRRLRTTIEQHGLSINQQFVIAAGAIIQAPTLPLTPSPHHGPAHPALLVRRHACKLPAMAAGRAAQL